MILERCGRVTNRLTYMDSCYGLLFSSREMPSMSASTTSKRSRRHSVEAGVSSSASESDPAAAVGGVATRRGIKRPGVWIAVGAFLLVAVVGGILTMQGGTRRVQLGTAASAVPATYDSERAFGYLEKICAIGPRISGTQGMQQQQQLLIDFFEKQNGVVQLQAFDVRHPLTGARTTLANLIARFGVDRPKRYLIAAHYDTRPFPDRDPVNPRGVFLGANDGGSGVAALMELSHHLRDLPSDVGVDLILFDGEELVYDSDRDPYFLGSTHFAREYLAQPTTPRYQAGILLDMVGDAEQHFYIEKNSWRYARPVVREVWGLAEDLGVKSFHSRVKHEVRDDHIPLNTIARIPTIDIIDFDYPRPTTRGMSYWHTQQDVPANCSGESLAAVVYVVHQWLQSK